MVKIDPADLERVNGGQTANATEPTAMPVRRIEGTARTIDMGSGRFLLYVEKPKPSTAAATEPKNPATISPQQLAGVGGGLGPPLPPAAAAGAAPKPDPGKAAVQRAYQHLEEVNALRNEASRLWWSGNPNDRSTAMFMLKRAGIPVN